MIVDYIDEHHHVHGVEPICAALSDLGVPIASSTYYARKTAPLTAAERDDAYTANALFTLWEENWRVYGVRKLWHAARRANLRVGRDQVARLMRLAGISGAVRGRHKTVTTRRDDRAPRHPDLVKRGWDAPTEPDQLWVADFTYVWTLAGFVYVAFIVDVYSRRILGWQVSYSKQTTLVTKALGHALATRRRHRPRWAPGGLVHHSDAGSQYTSIAFTADLAQAGLTGSIGTVGDALDNALMESTIGLCKTEAIDCHPGTWPDRATVHWQIARWVHWYNNHRLHSSIGHQPPTEFEHHHYDETQAHSTEVA